MDNRPTGYENSPLKTKCFGLNPRFFFRDFFGDHFARVESSGDQNLTMFILFFFCCIFDPPKQS